MSTSPAASRTDSPQFSTSPLKKEPLKTKQQESSYFRPSMYASASLRDVSSISIHSSASFDIINQYDLLFKQIDRQRSELYQRLQDRISRAKQLGQICNDQMGHIKTKIMELEERINEANNDHFNKHILNIDPRLGIDTLSEIISSDSSKDDYSSGEEDVLPEVAPKTLF